jgi:hypothetical protein
VAFAPDHWEVFVSAWRRGAAYAAFFLALGALRDAAEHSAVVRRCGAHLLAQPAGRRYLALTAGGHVFGIILSYGAIDLFGAMLARIGEEDVEAAGPRRRRMLMAVYRGFATMNCWSPLNIMTAVVSTAVPAAAMRPLLPVGFALAVLVMAAGWLLDRREGPDKIPPLDSGERWTIHLRIAALVALVMLAAEAVAARFTVTLSIGVTAMVPLIGLAWTIGQLDWRQRPAQALRHRLGLFLARVPGFRGEATVLAAGGFVGVALAAALPAGALAGLGLHGVLVPLLVPVVLIATGLLGLNPIAVVAVIGAAIPNPAALGVAPDVLALACMLGWGVAVGMTPMSASAIATARWTASDPWIVTLQWNAGFTTAALALACAAIVIGHLATS